MKRKFFFFDIDGTLTDQNPGGKVLDSTYRTLKKLQENGHVVSIATGREYVSAAEFAKKANIANMITDGGNGLVVDHQLIHIHPLHREDALKVIDECNEKDVGICVMIDETRTWYSHNTRLYDHYKEKPYFTLTVNPWLDYHEIPQFFKIYAGLTAEEEDKITSIKETGIPYSRYSHGHIEIEPDDKYQGILDMLQYLGGNEEDVVVFGDGKNDIKMMKRAKISIAMGNAIEEVKAAATFTTKRNDEDGIEYACKHFGWID
ncbi:Cof-type HAD-IIB family hydrolase [Beduini massiliensis]|uniref:Cof-type HAD-IIB family hydrolase n=1 Tax=Beduini massiliensis TaxID=1585974 RepID=UPI00059A889F|nr:Cof-type HAD-IIB family hydrolase [Beduini massiliensis]